MCRRNETMNQKGNKTEKNTEKMLKKEKKKKIETKWSNEVLSRLDVCESLKFKDRRSSISRKKSRRLDNRASILRRALSRSTFIEIHPNIYSL